MLDKMDPNFTAKDSKEDEEIRRVLFVLARSNSSTPLDYISLHTGIKKPLQILEEMSVLGLVCRSTPSMWSCSKDPLFEITPKGRERLYQVFWYSISRS